MRARLVPLVLLSVACQRARPPVPAPPAEFIVAAADSVFWIRSDADGIRVRGAPMVLAQIGGRFAELYVSDADYSFYDAVFIGQRLFKRDIVSGDSVQLVVDTLMPALARAYAAANPEERPLDADEQGSENPRTVATGDVTVLDVVGPWLSYEHLTDVDVVGGANSHGARRGVVDLRTASAAPLDAIIGAAAARRAVAAARTEWGALRDSLALLAADSTLAASSGADRFAFDPRSFSLGVLDRALQVRFAVTQTGAEEEAGVLELGHVEVDQPDWWAAVSNGYPIDAQAPDGAVERVWAREDFVLVGRAADSPQARVSLAIRDAAGSEWRLGSVPSPIQRVMWIGDTADVPGMRAALTKAFNDASFYSGENRIVNHTLRGQRPESFVRPASRRRAAPPTPRRIAPRARVRTGA
ncbi:MAG: hypothetical protein K8S21_12185 [Gemmatimonadetes bacterium]|nr:hypothetical protein [Gemmatimonadota bacterium]